MTFPLLVVIHETKINAEHVIRLHGDSNYYASYHALIHRNGFITYLTPGDCKAYAAANSQYTDIFGEKQHVNNSVDDFAYHITLESPTNSFGLTAATHIGFTKEQYESLAWLCAAIGVATNRITTHGKIITPNNLEPECFNEDYFFSRYMEKKKMVSKQINLGILDYYVN
jgi:N-acetyl-anhydromuramyl-L-alanine amidase AmpD